MSSVPGMYRAAETGSSKNVIWKSSPPALERRYTCMLPLSSHRTRSSAPSEETSAMTALRAASRRERSSSTTNSSSHLARDSGRHAIRTARASAGRYLGRLAICGGDQLVQTLEPALAVANEASDAFQDVRGGQVRLVHDLVNRAPRAPAVVPVGTHRVLGTERPVHLVAHELDGPVGDRHGIEPVGGSDHAVAIRGRLASEQLRTDGGDDLHVEAKVVKIWERPDEVRGGGRALNENRS